MFRQWLSGARGQGGDLGGRVGNCKKRTRALLKSTQPYLGAVQDDASGVGTDVGRIERELLASQAAVSKALVELVHAQQV